MGLDMYLQKSKKVEKEEVAYWRKANAIHAWFERNLCQEDEEIENCRPYYVSKEDLIKLKKDCQTVLNSSKLVYKEVPYKKYDYDKKDYVESTTMANVLEDSSVAEELLPTQSGFFFGDTSYGEGYVEDLKETITQIDEILANTDFDEYNIEYYAWW